jgi:hypothetical protein
MNQENGVAGNIPAQNQPPVRPMKVTLSPIPPNSTTITHIASICRGSKKRAPIEDVVECFKLKILQIEEESKSKIRSISFIGNRNDRIRLLNLKLSFNKCVLKQNFPMMKRSVIIGGKLQLRLRKVKPKKQHGLKECKMEADE